MRETALLVRVDRLHDELVDVGEAIEEKEELYELDSHRFLIVEWVVIISGELLLFCDSSRHQMILLLGLTIILLRVLVENLLCLLKIFLKFNNLNNFAKVQQVVNDFLMLMRLFDLFSVLVFFFSLIAFENLGLQGNLIAIEVREPV